MERHPVLLQLQLTSASSVGDELGSSSNCGGAEKAVGCGWEGENHVASGSFAAQGDA